eukprot:365693-Chlamydomonas_euryale.AAC.9
MDITEEFVYHLPTLSWRQDNPSRCMKVRTWPLHTQARIHGVGSMTATYTVWEKCDSRRARSSAAMSRRTKLPAAASTMRARGRAGCCAATKKYFNQAADSSSRAASSTRPFLKSL